MIQFKKKKSECYKCEEKNFNELVRQDNAIKYTAYLYTNYYIF